MQSNLDRYKKDLDCLVDKGENLLNAMQFETFPEEFKRVGEEKARHGRSGEGIP